VTPIPGWDACFDSPLGPLGATATAAGITRLHFDPAPRATTVADGGEAHLQQLKAQIAEYFAGTRRTFELALAPAGSAFQHQVWALLQQINYGETRSYGDLARALGDASAARAVGLANAQTPLAIVVPCHRVIGANGALTGYAGGLERKRALLELEGALPRSLFS